jgi:hypothetical protein
MSYRVYHDYDDDRDVITCVTLSDTRPVARMQPISGARPGRWIRRLWRSSPRENLLSGSLPHGRGQGIHLGSSWKSHQARYLPRAYYVAEKCEGSAQLCERNGGRDAQPRQCRPRPGPHRRGSAGTRPASVATVGGASGPSSSS